MKHFEKILEELREVFKGLHGVAIELAALLLLLLLIYEILRRHFNF